MAGIIARITRSNRERLEKKHCEVNINKSIYDILPFDRCFIPEVSKQKPIQNLFICESNANTYEAKGKR